MKFEIYKDDAKQWRWRLKAANGEIIGTSGEGYKNRKHVRKMVESIINHAQTNEYRISYEK